MISESLRRLFGPRCTGCHLGEPEVSPAGGIRHRIGGLVDYDDFTIPYEGPIRRDHLQSHADPRGPAARVLRGVRRSLKPGGYIYFYNEPDDAEYLLGNQSMFATLNPLHMQAFDMPSFVRGLRPTGLT
jgi:hypothetical protein